MDEVDLEEGTSGPFRLNEPAVIADVIDGEVVIMNLEHGSYYGLDEVGADVWRMIMAGKTGTEISEEVAKHFSIGSERVLKDVSALIAKMIEQDLLVLAETSAAPIEPPKAEITAGQYVQPDIAIYSDMKELLAFDPPLPTYEPAAKE